MTWHYLALERSNLINLLSTAALRIKLVTEPLGSQSTGKLKANNALTHAKNLGVVALDTTLDAEAVVGGHGTDALDLVGGDGDAQTSAADEQSTVGLALCDEANGGSGAGWVGSLVSGLVGANVNNFAHARVRLKVLLDGILVRDAGFLYVEHWLAS